MQQSQQQTSSSSGRTNPDASQLGLEDKKSTGSWTGTGAGAQGTGTGTGVSAGFGGELRREEQHKHEDVGANKIFGGEAEREEGLRFEKDRASQKGAQGLIQAQEAGRDAAERLSGTVAGPNQPPTFPNYK